MDWRIDCKFISWLNDWSSPERYRLNSLVELCTENSFRLPGDTSCSLCRRSCYCVSYSMASASELERLASACSRRYI